MDWGPHSLSTSEDACPWQGGGGHGTDNGLTISTHSPALEGDAVQPERIGACSFIHHSITTAFRPVQSLKKDIIYPTRTAEPSDVPLEDGSHCAAGLVRF